MDNPIAVIKQQLAQLKELHAAGVLPQAQYEESKAALERRALDHVLQGTPSPSEAAPVGTKTSGKLVAALAVGVIVLAGVGYWWKGTPSQISTSIPSAQTAGSPAEGDAPHATSSDQIAAMVDKLAARLKDQPNDAEGWAMLARSYSVLGQHPEALKAYKKAVALRKDDATLLADYADSLAVKNNRSLAGEPMKQVERALKLDPHNAKALSLAGTFAFDRKDYAGAVKYWEQVVQFGPADSSVVQQVAPGLAEARDLAGLPADNKPMPLGNGTGTAGAPTSTAFVSGTVTLAPALRKQAMPDDTVFIFARAAQGSRMPLALVRTQVKDLPYQFRLDDSMAMSSTNPLSSASKVVVGARVSKGADAMPQPGDLSGQTTPVNIGAVGVVVEIKEVVKP